MNPFFTVALPIIVTLIWSVITQNCGFSEMGKRIDDVIRRLERIEAKLAVQRPFGWPRLFRLPRTGKPRLRHKSRPGTSQ